MQVFDRLCPAPPHWSVPWQAIDQEFEWVRAMSGVEQDRVHHAEGDVAVHTRMAVEALASLPQWRRRPPADRVRLFAAVLLHDVGKPSCTQHHDDGTVTAHGHSRRGELTTRRILWRLGTPIAWREQVAALVRHHQVPFWALERPDLRQIALRISLTASNDDLAMLATADILGRSCADSARVLDNIALFQQYCAELGVLDQPWQFASDHARFTYFRSPDRDPAYAAYDDTRLTVTVLSGLPGVGKDHWVSENRPDLPVVSLDDIRASLGVKPGGNQQAVVKAAYEQARGLLREGRSFVWNATNITRQQRDMSIELVAAYRGRVELVALEATEQVLRARNRRRDRQVPNHVIDRLIDKWESPDPTEAHQVRRIDTGQDHHCGR